MAFYHTKTCRERHAIPSTFAISLYLLTLFQIFFMVHPRFCREIPIQFDGISHLFPKMAWGKTTHQRTNKKKIPTSIEAKQCPNEGTKHLAAWPPTFSALALQCPWRCKRDGFVGSVGVFFCLEKLLVKTGETKKGGVEN